MNRIHASLRLLSALLLAMIVLQGSNALNPFCGCPPRPVHFLSVGHNHRLRASAAGIRAHREWQSHVSSSVVVINGTALRTQVLSNSQLQVTLTTAVITGPGTARVAIKTPSGTSGNLGCTSGGTSHALTLTIT
jgi:hypothetical protein